MKWKQWTYNNWSSRSDIWTIKDSAPQKKYITTSLIKSREGFIDSQSRDIYSEYVNILLKTFSLNSSVVDLGDSRGFKTSKELIDKINYIRGSKFYVGSQVSWKDIARIFGIYVLILEPLPSSNVVEAS